VPVAGRPRNPLGEAPTRFHERVRVFVARPGQTPGLSVVDTHADRQAPGQIRRNYRQSINLLPPATPFSWTQNPPIVTRSLRYKATSVYRQAGALNSRYGARRKIIVPKHNQPVPTLGAGNLQRRPTVRNRIISFGSRVPTVNQRLPAGR
jgi:hypothetical protein